MSSDIFLRNVWQRLSQVRRLFFHAESRSAENTGWNGVGEGSVVIQQPDDVTLLFQEQGSWKSVTGSRIRFSNVYRWTFDDAGQTICLEHLRFGADNPVYLFDLIAAGEGELCSSSPHVCREDYYTAWMRCDPDMIHLHWTVTGPHKDEEIAYTYQ
jgi:hypothetical protein